MAQTPITDNTTVTLKEPGGGGVTTKVIQFDFNGVTGALTLQARVRGSGLTFRSLPYRKRFLNNAAGDDTYVTGDITNHSIIEFNDAGLDTQLLSTVSAGSIAWDYLSLNG